MGGGGVGGFSVPPVVSPAPLVGLLLLLLSASAASAPLRHSAGHGPRRHLRLRRAGGRAHTFGACHGGERGGVKAVGGERGGVQTVGERGCAAEAAGIGTGAGEDPAVHLGIAAHPRLGYLAGVALGGTRVARLGGHGCMGVGHGCCGGVAAVLQWCCSGVAAVLQRCCSAVAAVLRWCCGTVAIGRQELSLRGSPA